MRRQSDRWTHQTVEQQRATYLRRWGCTVPQKDGELEVSWTWYGLRVLDQMYHHVPVIWQLTGPELNQTLPGWTSQVTTTLIPKNNNTDQAIICLSVFHKTLAFIIKGRIAGQANLMAPEQNCFRTGSLVERFSYWLKHCSPKTANPDIRVWVWFGRAYDRVPHMRLVHPMPLAAWD